MGDLNAFNAGPVFFL